MKKLLRTPQLTPAKDVQQLIENRRFFNMKHCELNIFETYQQVNGIYISFNDIVITSMVRGKKIIQLGEKPAFVYSPGETVIANCKEKLLIDFPEASLQNPAQCIALTLDADYVKRTINQLKYQYGRSEIINWELQFDQYHFNNNDDIASALNKLVNISCSHDVLKDVYADLSLKELLMRLMQSQNLSRVSNNIVTADDNRMHYIIQYIQQHLSDKISIDDLSKKAYLSRNIFYKYFKQQFGITPLDYINQERIKFAKELLEQKQYSISDVSLQCGFTDVNYFVRIFKKLAGVTPGRYMYGNV